MTRSIAQGLSVAPPADLPEPDVDVDADMLQADWPTIGAAAAAALRADALDTGLDSFLSDRLDDASAGWARSLFDDPIIISDPPSGYINGRHRSACLRQTGSPVTVI